MKVSGSAKRPTPCVGICSTTYGDLVCRGCMRYAHEIVQWNGYNGQQQAIIWQRLEKIRNDAIAFHLQVSARDAFDSACKMANLTELDEIPRRYELLRFAVVRGMVMTQIGMQTVDISVESEQALAVMQKLDQEIYQRSRAHYERNFRISV